MARKMKDSGIEWMGDIPENWSCIKGKYIFIQRSERGNRISLELLSPTQKFGVIPQKLYEELTTNTAVKVQENTNLELFKTIHRGDFCISLRSFQGGFEFSCYEGVVSPAYQVFYPVQMVCREYYKYLFKDQSFIDVMNSYSMSLRDGKNIAFSDFSNTYIPTPPIQEQKKIADYLDKKCAKIDSLSSDIQSQISVLEDYKKSVITEAVTKGLNPDVEMKDSGIEWIGEIPKHWIIIRAKNIVIIGNGSDPKKDGSIPVYGSGANSFKTCGEYKEAPAVLIGRKGATLHIPHYIEERYWNVDTAFDVKEKDNRVILKYYYYNAICFDYKKYISQTTLPSMTQTDYGNMYIPYPRKEEQKDIVKYLDTKCAEIDIAIIEKKKQLEVLEQYKKSLIYEYVTGKREVSDNNG